MYKKYRDDMLAEKKEQEKAYIIFDKIFRKK